MNAPLNNLAKWIVRSYQSDDLTPLKIQKLMFYCTGIAHGLGKHDVDALTFEAWKYGPVHVPTYRSLKTFAEASIPKGLASGIKDYSLDTEKLLNTVLNVYGRLSAIKLVHQTHMERPYVEEWTTTKSQIEPEKIKNHFFQKYGKPNEVFIPEMIFDRGSFEIDGIPVRRFKDIFEVETFLNEL